MTLNRDRFGFYIAALFLALLLPVSGCRQADDSWERVAEAGVLRVGLDPTFPPFATAEGEDVKGLDVDLAQALADELGLTVEFVYFGYDGLYDALATDQVDVLISAMVVAPERTRDFAYGRQYYNAGQVLIVPNDENAATGMETLSGKTVAVELGALGHVEAMSWARRLPQLTVRTYESVEAALGAVAEGEVDAAIVDSVGGRLYLREDAAERSRPLKLLPEPVTVEPYAVVVRKEDDALLQKLNAAMESLSSGGRLEALIHQWLGP